MAEATGLRNNAIYPIYAQPWGIVFPLLDETGAPISPSSPDSEKSLNGDTFSDCTNEAVEIATSTGVCYLLLNAAEMTADVVAVRIQSTGAKTTVVVLYPRKLVTLRAGTAAGGAAGSITLDASASAVDDFYNGCVVAGVLDSTNEVRIITDYTGSTKVAAVTPNWNTTPDSDDTFIVYLPEGRQINQANVTTWNGTAVPSEHTAGYPIATIKDGTGTGEINTNAGAVALVDLVTTTSTATAVTTVNGFAAGSITAAAIANGAIDAATFAADVDAEILSYIVDDATRIDASQLNTHTAITVAGIADGVWDEDATGHQTGGTFGQAIGDPGASTETLFKAIITDPAGTNIAADIIAIKAETASILEDTGTTLQAELDGIEADVDAILVDTGTTLQGELDGIEADVDTLLSRLGTPSDLGGGATVAANLADIEGQTDDLAAFITRLTGLVMAQGTIGSTGNSTTALHLDGLTYGDDELNDYLLVIRDVSESEYHARWIADWDLSDELATVATLPFTPQNATDTYWLLPVRRDVTGGSGATAQEVWEYATRTLTAIDEDSTTLDLDATVRAAVGLATANLDTQLADIEGKVDDLESRLGTPSDLGSGATVAGNLVDIESQTDDIGVAGAGLTAINLPDQTMNITGNITGNLSGSVGSVSGAVGSVTGAVGSVGTGGITEASFATTAGTFHPLNIVDQGTAQSAGATTLVLRAAAAFADDEIVGSRILITGGTTGVGQSRLITDYVSATDTATVSAWTVEPTGTITYKIFGSTAAAGGSAPTAAEVADAVWDEDASGHQSQGSFGQAIGDPVADTNTIYAAVVTGAAGATIAADIVDIEGKVDDLESRLGSPSDFGSGATVAANLVDIEGQTDDIGVAGAGLTAINLPDQTMNIIGNITGNLSGSVGSVTGLTASNLDATVSSRSSQTSVDDLPTNAELATSQAAADDATLAAIAALNNLSAAQVNTEVDTALVDVGLTTTITGRIDAAVSTRSSQTSVDDLPTNAELTTALGTADDAVLSAVATVDTVVDAIKLKTDSLTFTEAGVVDANVKAVNDTTITGSGTTPDPWNPA